MATLEVILQALFGITAVFGILAGLHYRDSLCCVYFRLMHRRRVEYHELDSSMA